MKNLTVLLARITLGLILVVFGLNGFFLFIPVPAPEPAGGAFIEAMIATGYLLPFVKLTEVICGVMILSGRFVGLAAVIVAPVVLNIAAYHIFLDSRGIPMGLMLMVLTAIVAFSQRDRYRALLRA